MRTYVRFPVLLFLLLLSVAACKRASEESRSDIQYNELPPAATAGEPAIETNHHESDSAVPSDTSRRATPMLIRTGEMRVRVSNLDRSRAEAVATIQRLGGYVGNESEQNASYGSSASLTLRVPSARYDSLVALLSDLGTVENRSTQVEDVTRAYADLDARTRTRRATEERYRELLARANTVEEVMAVERQLGELRAEIEGSEAQLRTMRDQSAMSTLTVTLATTTSGASGPSFFTRLVDALRDGGALLSELLLAGVRLWGVWLLLALAWFGWTRWGRPWRTRRRSVRPAPPDAPQP